MIKPKNMNLSKNEVLNRGEVPESIIFFSYYQDNKGNARIFAERVNLKVKGPKPDHEALSKLIAKKIKKYKRILTGARALGSKDTVILAKSHRRREKAAKALSTKSRVTHRAQTARPFDIDGPTLLVFGTGFKNKTFTAPYITPRGSKNLDPNCSGARLWNNASIMGWYSKTHTPPKGEKNLRTINADNSYFYDLHTRFEADSGVWESSFDPGNGTGGGPRWPPD